MAMSPDGGWQVRALDAAVLPLKVAATPSCDSHGPWLKPALMAQAKTAG
eukprot:CAMPEP_0177534646 /NCGR_PEP_ID=MMETSP0369-20130122/56074_1 /TAXON_ID=447022 ORGANISM="Scrippsiella hangoei-like, Strain SHHI-4" /NCGR_SAMPLE_ID=MMETSP0369 /ASSEMBLY_ACC=CAM_ASM_000364 /LENGTH=48 /DNA_ID= /DNA_START= /DNA_END= /DNA_ORIENTATION=